MPELDPLVQAGIISGVVALIITVVGYLVNQGQNKAAVSLADATASETITKTSLSLIEPLQAKIVELERDLLEMTRTSALQAQRIADLERNESMRDAEMRGLRAGVGVLTAQLERLFIVPEYTPPTIAKVVKTKGD